MIKKISLLLIILVVVFSMNAFTFAEEDVSNSEDVGGGSSTPIEPQGSRSSEIMNELTGSNSSIAQGGEKPPANTVENINNHDGDVFSSIPGTAQVDGNKVYVGEVNEGTSLPETAYAAVIVCNSDAFVGENGNFDSVAYAAVRIIVNAYVAEHPDATPAEINAVVEAATDGAASYQVCEVGKDNTNVYILFDDADSTGSILAILGITDNPEGKVALYDICADIFKDIDISKLTFQELIDLILEALKTDTRKK